MTKQAYWAALLLAVAVSCASGPAPPKTGTPEYYWLSAMETYQAGQYEKQLEHLDKIIRSGDALVAKAAPLRLLTLSGLARGYQDLAAQFQLGAESIKTGSSADHRRRSEQYRAQGANFALQLAEAYAAFEKSHASGPVTIDFPYPARGAMTLPPVFSRVGQGQLIPEMEIERMQTAVLQRAVLREISSAVGAPGDVAQAQAKLKTLPLETERNVFLAAIGESLYESSVIFGPRGRGETPRQAHLLELATRALAGAEGDNVKDLKAKIAKDTKDAESRKKR